MGKYKKKILLIVPDLKTIGEISTYLNISGYEITDVVPYLFDALASVEKNKPDIIMIDTYITEQIADFFYSYLGYPLIIISQQNENELSRFKDKINIVGVIGKPLTVYDFRSKTTRY
jgi:hypothetical protein